MNEFRKARITLTSWYILISIAMLLVFSFAAISAEKKSFSKIEAVLGDKVQRPRLTSLLEQRLDNFESDFLRRLIFFDVALLGFSAGASWFLSGKTLKPIQIMIKNQEAFAADVSHELRTPLATVNMEIESIKRTTSKIPQIYSSIFKSIQEEVKRMSILVEGLLLMVRTNQNPSIFTTIHLSDIADKTLSRLGLMAKEKQIQYDLKIEKNISIKGDRDQLKRLITIFVDNAIKYSPPHGRINICLYRSGNTAVLSIADTGIGISKEAIPHIFERFYRADLNDKIRPKGSGLGLSIAQKIIQQHGGTVKVISVKGKGATFTLHFPIVS